MTIWITQKQYDAVMASISKIPVLEEDVHPITLLVPPLYNWKGYAEPEKVTNPRLRRKLIRIEFQPVLRDPHQSRNDPPEMIWQIKTDVQICDEWLANEMQSMII